MKPMSSIQGNHYWLRNKAISIFYGCYYLLKVLIKIKFNYTYCMYLYHPGCFIFTFCLLKDSLQLGDPFWMKVMRVNAVIHKVAALFLFYENIGFWPRLNMPIFLLILGWKYSCNILNYSFNMQRQKSEIKSGGGGWLKIKLDMLLTF